MKRKSLLVMLLVALFVPLAMNAQTKTLKKSANGSKPKLEMKVSKEMPSNPMLSRFESAKEAALEELNNRAGDRGTTTVTASKITAANSTWTGSGGETWNVAITISNTSGLNQNVTNGYAQFGTQRNYATSGTFSTSGISGTITSIDVDCASYNGSGTVSVTVGGSAFGSSQSIPNWSNNAGGTRTFTGSASGNIVVTMTNGSSTHRAMYIKSITVTYSPAGCSAPEDFEATNVTSNSATLSWTETGTSDSWVIYYMAEDDEDVSYEVADTNPFTLTGLDPVTTYYALVTPNCGDLDQDSEVITFTTADLPCPRPDDLVANNLTTNSATFSWTGEGESYNLQYRTPGGREIILYEDFEGDWPGNWTETSIGSNTGIYSGAPNSGTYMYGFMRNGSYIQYLISPELSNVEEGSVVAFYHLAYNANATIYVGYSTTTTATNAFTWGSAQTVTASTSYDMYYMEIPAGTKYVGIRVNAMTSSAYYFVDDFFVAGPYVEPGEWHTANNVTSPYTATDLAPETEYEWQVQAVCGGGDGESLWSELATFITPSACDTPIDLTATNITAVSATLNWPQSLESYNLRYGIPETKFFYDFEDATPWAVDSFSPCTTYDGDGSSTYGIQDLEFTNQQYTGAFIAFQNDVVSGLNAHGGIAFGACFAATTPPNNDFFILPSLTIETGDVFSFWAKQYTDTYPEAFRVGVYSNGSLSSYLAGSASASITPTTTWTQYSYDLSAYNGQTIQLAIQCVSNDAFIFCIDDIFVGNPHWNTPITCSAPYTLGGLEPNTEYAWQVQGINCDGNGHTTDWSGNATFTTLEFTGVLVESITADNVTVLVGGTASITNLTVLPADATNPAVTYASNDATIATVDADGVVTGVAPGETTITIAATDGSNVTGTITVTVNGIDVTNIAASDVTVVNGQTATITYTVTPNNATDASVTFTSEDATIATVDADGVVTGVGVGTTTITITSVSNPEITAEITVTVTSNPNAVQFTLNVTPTTAHPGDVITVEAYLNAPTEGTYTGFTGLVLGLHFDPTAFEVYGNPVAGPVASACSFSTPGLPNATHPDLVQYSLAMPLGTPNTTTGLVFTAQFTVLTEVELGSYTFYAEPTSASNFVYAPDATNPSNKTPILYEYVPSTVVVSMPLTKHIVGYNAPAEEGGNGANFYLIASPIGEVAPTEVTNMISNIYDLYRFNQAAKKEWENYKQYHYDLEVGKGYLYANSNTVDLVFTGEAYNGSGEVTLSKTDDTSVEFPGWNLVGNPFAETVYIADGRSFYIMNANGSELETPTSNSIEAMEGIFVIASQDGETITFTTEQPSKGNGQVAVSVSRSERGVASSSFDRIIVSFDEGRELPKFQLFEDHAKLYIVQDGADYAVVSAEAQGEVPVCFKADENGTYTLSIATEDMDMNYLHLVDNMTGMDIDLLQTPSYSFEARTTDYESRFKLVFASASAGTETFAFFSNGNWIINNEGEATLQVIDINGRILSSETVSGCFSKAINAASGVYMLRLINGDNVKVQKIVVR